MNFSIKTLSVLLVALVALMFSCHKSSENPNAAIAGTWRMTQVVKTGCTDPGFDNTVTYTCPATASSSCQQITFNTNGTFSENEIWIDSFTGNTNTENSSGTFSIKGNQLTAVLNGNTYVQTFTVSSDKRTLTLVYKYPDTGCLETDTLIK